MAFAKGFMSVKLYSFVNMCLKTRDKRKQHLNDIWVKLEFKLFLSKRGHVS